MKVAVLGTGTVGQTLAACRRLVTMCVTRNVGALMAWSVGDDLFSARSRQRPAINVEALDEAPAFTLKQYAHVIPGMQAEAATTIARLVNDTSTANRASEEHRKGL